MTFEMGPRREEKGVEVYEPWQIQALGYGRETLLQLDEGNELVVTKQRAFLLSCTHLVHKPDQIGGPCVECVEIAEAEGHPYPMWMAMKCRECFSRCDAPFCGKGLCPEHAGRARDNGHSYCLEHYKQLEAETEVERKGFVRSKLAQFSRSLFYFGDDDKPRFRLLR